ncbi:MAG: IclR family transcriptional regulator [Ectothiorhodospiraceae bacterium]|nr:IclR family transcriptional regulator [Ectothiorhodospiraceae bacterium]
MSTSSRPQRPEPATGVPRRESGSALAKALHVLEAIVSKEQPVGLAYLTEELRLPKPTVHRVLMQLEQTGLVQRTPDRNRYLIGPMLNRLAAATLGSRNQHHATRGILMSLVQEVGETCNVGVLDQHEVRYIERVECDAPLRVQIGAGHHVPAHCTALGKLFLAELAPAEVDRVLRVAPLRRYTDNTIVDRRELDDEMSRIRTRGFSTNDQEFGVGIIAVAVPIRDASGQVLAGVAMHAPTPRMSLKRALSYRATLMGAADRLAVAWGLRTDAPQSHGLVAVR